MQLDIKNIIKVIKRREAGLSDPQLIFPERDWVVALVLTAALISVGGIWSVVQYRTYTITDVSPAEVAAMVPYRAAFVENALTKYREITTENNAIAGSPTSSEEVLQNFITETEAAIPGNQSSAATNIGAGDMALNDNVFETNGGQTTINESSSTSTGSSVDLSDLEIVVETEIQGTGESIRDTQPVLE